MLIEFLQESFVPKTADEAGDLANAARAVFVPASDLFGSLDAAIANLMLNGPSDDTVLDASPVAAFIMGEGLALTVDWESVRPCHVQALISFVARLCDASASGTLQAVSLDSTCGLAFWTRGAPELAATVAAHWRTVTSIGKLDQFTTLTTPRLYGNKVRLTGFVAPIVSTHLSEGVPVLDLMSGTGVVSRALAERHPVSNNDANAYAALLARSHGIDGSALDVPALLVRLQGPYQRNYEELSAKVRAALDAEAGFLHGEINKAAVSEYAAFALHGPLEPSTGHGPGPSRLVTERYANVYFGILQSVEIDSLRAAIEACYPEACSERDLCLSALLLACTACSSGPHFAQPPRLKPESDNASRQMRTLVERRAKSVAWEFDLAIARLVARAPLAYPFGRTTQMDWREAIDGFVGSLGGRKGGVYADPPYSKLQYSRYYHVLNVILAYGYPPVSGMGRYPPKSERFSSRFEYQPGGARRELSALLKACADGGLTTFLSYSDVGFVPLEVLAQEMARYFGAVEVFTEEVRHHAQGRPLKSFRATVREHVLVGLPAR